MLLPRQYRLFLPITLLSLSTTLPPALALPAPAPAQPQPQVPTRKNLTSPPTSLLVTENTCIPKRSFFTPCPEYYDCVQAIFKLPRLSGPGSFHNGAPDDVFMLPVEKTHESCRVRVELVHEGSSRQSESWANVVARALRLGDACINTPLRAPEFLGGWTTLGKQKRLVILLEHNGGIGYGGIGAGGVDVGEGTGNGNNVTVL